MPNKNVEHWQTIDCCRVCINSSNQFTATLLNNQPNREDLNSTYRIEDKGSRRLQGGRESKVARTLVRRWKAYACELVKSVVRSSGELGTVHCAFDTNTQTYRTIYCAIADGNKMITHYYTESITQKHFQCILIVYY